LQGTVLLGTWNGKPLSGADFIGATVSQNDPGGEPFSATITEVRTDPQDASCEVMLYKVMVKSAAGPDENLCEPDPWNERWAMPVAGSWDSTGAHVDSPGFMFACTSGVVAKCIRWGYRPWKKIGDRSLAEYHQACTRMARADYCGDGVSHTENGTLIDMYDRLKIQTKSPPSLTTPMLFDAAWTPSGAYCIAKERWLKLGELPAVLSCKGKFKLLPQVPSPGELLGGPRQAASLVKTSPVDPLDLCLSTSDSLTPEQVLMDNQSGLNIELR